MARVSISSSLALLLGALLFMVAQVQGAKGPIITNKVCLAHSICRTATGPPAFVKDCCGCRLGELTGQVYFDLEHGGRPLGRVVMGLYGK
jgi:hypothetical protein